MYADTYKDPSGLAPLVNQFSRREQPLPPLSPLGEYRELGAPDRDVLKLFLLPREAAGGMRFTSCDYVLGSCEYFGVGIAIAIGIEVVCIFTHFPACPRTDREAPFDTDPDSDPEL